MAKVIKLKNRSGEMVLPLTRSQLVQVSQITGLDLVEGKNWTSASVQDALNALMTYATTIKESNATALTDIATIKNALEDVLDNQRAVANYVDSAKDLSYAEAASKAQTAQDNAYAYAGKVAAEALQEVDVTVAATSGSVITGFEIEDGKLKANSVSEVALTSSNVTRTATTGDHGVAATNVEGAIVELSTKVDTAYTNAEAYTDEKVNALKGTLNGTIAPEAGKVFASITQTDGVLSYTDAALTASDITRTATAKVAGTTVEAALASLADSIDAGGTGSVVSVTEVTSGLADDVLKAYKIYQGDASNESNLKGTINIPKDLVVTAGSVVNGSWSGDTFTEGSGTDKALKLVIANQTAPVYINPTDFIDVYTANNQSSEVTVAIDNNNNVTATIGTVAASKISYNDTTVDAELTNINATLTAHQNDLTSYQGRIATTESTLSSYNTRIEALETSAANLSYNVVAGTNEAYIAVTPSTSGGATTFTVTSSNIASDTNLQALQTSYNTMNTELNSGVFFEQVGSSTIDDVTLSSFK